MGDASRMLFAVASLIVSVCGASSMVTNETVLSFQSLVEGGVSDFTAMEGGWTSLGLRTYARSNPLYGGVYLSAVGHYIASPTIAGRIVSVEVETASSAAELSRFLSVVPIVSSVTNLSDAVALSTTADYYGYVKQVASLHDLGFVDAVVLRIIGSGSGNWAVRSVVLRWVEEENRDAVVPSPVGVCARGKSRDSFELHWEADSRVDSYVVDVWTNSVIGASSGETVFEENFNAFAIAASSVDITEAFNETAAGSWTGENVYSSDRYDGAIVLGNTKNAAVVESSPLDISGEGLRLSFSACRITKDDGAWWPIELRREGETFFSTNIQLSTSYELEDYAFALPELKKGDVLVMKSSSGTTRNGRVAVSSVRIIRGWREGENARAYILENHRVSSPPVAVEGLAPCDVEYSVRALRVFTDGTEKTSDAVLGSVNLADPPWMRVWRMGYDEILGRDILSRKADFSGMQAGTDENGVMADDVRFFVGEELATRLTLNGGNPNSAGAYITTVETEDGKVKTIPTIFGTSGNDVSAVLPVRLDVSGTFRGVRISWSAHQCTFRNRNATTLGFSYAIVDDVSDIASSAVWTVCDECDYVGEWTEETRPDGVDITTAPREFYLKNPVGGVSLKGKLLCLRFSVPKQANSAAMGFSDLTVSMDTHGKFAFIIR